MKNSEFWQWVCKRNAYDNPRGDFIRDTREAVQMGRDPAGYLPGAVERAYEEYQKLRRQYEREYGPLQD